MIQKMVDLAECENNNHRSNRRRYLKKPEGIAKLAILPFFLGNLHFCSALINCTYGDSALGNSRCVEKYRPGSICRENGFCSNPFRSGCLRNVLSSQSTEIETETETKTSFRLRACNSDDDPGAEERGECIGGDYDEIRILSQDWEGPMITAWIMQIILSEVLGVPTTLETSMPDSEASMNFYDGDMRFSYSNDTYVSNLVVAG